MKQMDLGFEGFSNTDVGFEVSHRKVVIELNAIQVSTKSAV